MKTMFGIFVALSFLVACVGNEADMPVVGQSNISEAAGQANFSSNLEYQVISGVPSDTPLFGTSIAMTDDHIYVGDPGKSRVAVFERSAGNKWRRGSDIYPTDNIKGFGYALAINDTHLVIGAYSRTNKEDGMVFSYNEKEGLREVAQTNSEFIVGFSVAADGNNISYSRRKQNDLKYQTGSVVVLSGGETAIYKDDQHPAYFGANISLSNNKLFVSVPALGPQGGAKLFDLAIGGRLEMKFLVPGGYGRVGASSRVSILDDYYLISGSGNPLGNASILWNKAGKIVGNLPGSGEVASFENVLVLSGEKADAHFKSESLGKIAIPYFNLANSGFDKHLLMNEHIQESSYRNSAISKNNIAVALYVRGVAPMLLIYSRYQL